MFLNNNLISAVERVAKKPPSASLITAINSQSVDVKGEQTRKSFKGSDDGT
jgi:hypothetical protein